MTSVKTFLKEFEEEAQITRNMLKCIPNDKYDWQPHQKSMKIRELSTHIAELPGWFKMALTTTELDFEQNPYTQVTINNTAELLEYLEKSIEEGRSQLHTTKDEDLEPEWTLKNGKDIYMTCTKGEVIRSALNQITHHRAQLGVYLRLLDIPIPGSYGPSADEPSSW